MWVQLPTGRLGLTVGEPVSTIPDGQALRPGEVTAPEGQVFLPVGLDKQGKGVPSEVSLPLAFRDIEAAPRVSLRVGAREHDLGGLGTPAFLQVQERDARQADLGLVVEFDGVSQSVDQNGTRSFGGAAGLYGLPSSLPNQDCSTDWRSRSGGRQVELAMRCSVRATNYPYLPGRGWAHLREPGHTWAVVSTATTFEWAVLPRAGAQRHRCLPSADGSGTTELGSVGPVLEAGELDSRTLDGSLVSGTAVFLVPEAAVGELRIERSHECRVESGEVETLQLIRRMQLDLRPDRR